MKKIQVLKKNKMWFSIFHLHFLFLFFFISVLPKVTGTLNNFSLNHGKIIFYLFEQKSEKCIIIKFYYYYIIDALMFLLQILNIFHSFFCFYCWLWTSKYQLGYLCYLITNTHWFYEKICNKQKEVKKIIVRNFRSSHWRCSIKRVQ